MSEAIDARVLPAPGRGALALPFSWARTVPYLLAAPLLVYMVVFYALPVVTMLLRSVTEPDWTLAHYAALADDTVFLKVFWNTLYTAVIVTLGALLLGYPVALALVRTRGWTAAIILIVILLPFWTSVLVRSYAWMVLLGRHGLINEALVAAGLLDRPLRLLNTPLATYIAMTHILLPYMILPIANALRQIDPSLAKAASGLGATPWRTFRQVILPLSIPGVAAGVLLVFVLSLGFYITPALLGSPQETTISVYIQQQIHNITRSDVLVGALRKLPAGSWRRAAETEPSAATRRRRA